MDESEKDERYIRGLGLPEEWAAAIIPRVSRLRLYHRQGQPDSDYYLRVFGDAHLVS
jgi:hypothetical protein